MKKFMFMAAAALMTLAANAQNPAGLKQVKSAKEFNAAKAIVDAEGATMTAAERAQAYNKLVDLAINEYTKAEERSVKAQVAQKADEQKAIDEEKLVYAYNAMESALKCDEADNQPNDKGQVKPKFRKANQSRLAIARNSFINGGLDAYNSKDYATAKKYFGAFVESRQSGLFEGFDFTAETNYGQIAYYAGLAAYFDKDYAKCTQYSDYSIKANDAEVLNDVVTLKLGAIEGMAKENQIDSVKYVADVQAMYEQFPENEMVFGKLMALLQDTGNNAGADALLKARIQNNPGDSMALAYVGQNAQNDGKWDEAIEAYAKAIEAKPSFTQAKVNLATCYLNRATNTYDQKADSRGQMAPDVKASVNGDLNNAQTILEEVSTVDPDELEIKWSYTLNRVKYVIEQINQ